VEGRAAADVSEEVGPQITQAISADSEDDKICMNLRNLRMKLQAELRLIDEYEFVMEPRIAGHGPTLFAGLSKHVDLKLVSRLELGSGAVAMRYEPRRSPSDLPA
jgi:hypothetical protein